MLAVYLGLSALFQWATPPLEASDEAAHVGYVLTLQRGHRLPVPARPGLAMQEALQPPLYYALGAALIAPFDTSAADACFGAAPGARSDAPISRVHARCSCRRRRVRRDERSPPFGCSGSCRWCSGS